MPLSSFTEECSNCAALGNEQDPIFRSKGYWEVRRQALVEANRLVARSNTNRAPLSPKLYASMCNAEVEEVDIDCAGQLLPAPPDRYVIQVRASDDSGRRNYTACHEVAHILFGLHRFFPDWQLQPALLADVARIEEKVCERVAAVLMMPQHLFLPIVRAHAVSSEAIGAIAEQFEVSFEAALIRVIQLNPWGCRFVRWEPVDPSAATPEFVATWVRSPERTDIANRTSLRAGPDSGIAVAYKTGKPVKERIARSYSMESLAMSRRGRRAVLSIISPRAN